MARLSVTVGEQGAAVNEGVDISFGRSNLATLKLDFRRSDAALSRICGIFTPIERRWQIVNMASSLRLDIKIEGGWRGELSPGSAPLELPVPSAGTLRLQTAQRYVLDYLIAGESLPRALPPLTDETTTVSVADFLGLSDQERLLLTALAEHRIKNPDAGAWSVATTAQLHARLGIKPKKIEDIVDSIAHKFAPYTDGLIGSNSGRAVMRRHQMVDFALRAGCIGSADLSLLQGR